jgi:23S rRNA (uracil1939-C5)-methyltransferase
MIEEMENLKFKIGPVSFFQTNSLQAYKLYQVARDFADLSGDEVVYDLYTGTGTIANFIASKAKKVVGIESVPAAIQDADVNAQINGIKNTVFYAGDIAKVLNEGFVDENGKPDVVITDPPRAGMVEKVIEQILMMLPQKIVYVSCNPSTQSRDVNLLSELYRVVKVQPVDMFPHTQHVENVMLLERKMD